MGDSLFFFGLGLLSFAMTAAAVLWVTVLPSLGLLWCLGVLH